MSSRRLRASLPLLLLLGGCLHAAAAKDQAPGPGRGSAGRFVSPGQHACSWQLRQPGPGPAAGSEVGLRCHGPDGARHECAFRGEPARCAPAGPRRALYWKQVLGALRRRRRPCLDHTPLRARVCASGGALAAELRLVPRAAPDRPTAASGLPGASRRGPRSRGPPEEKTPEKKTRAGRRKAASGPGEGRPAGPGLAPDGPGGTQIAELAETCADQWRSVCSFLVRFWHG